ncbi:MAG: hypothetical protein WD696_21130 [Bryobacteraceae bacterium]
MPSRTATYRLASVAILLLVGVELFACEMVSPDTCEILGTSESRPSGQSSPGDDCLCCCYHVIVVPPVTLALAEIVSPAPEVFEKIPIAAEPHSIYHPPKA